MVPFQKPLDCLEAQSVSSWQTCGKEKKTKYKLYFKVSFQPWEGNFNELMSGFVIKNIMCSNWIHMEFSKNKYFFFFFN